MNPHAAQMRPVSITEIDERVTFIRKTYTHLLGAVLAFIGLSFAIMQLPFIHSGMEALSSYGGMAWLGVLGAFMLVGVVANRFAHDVGSKPKQYLGLGLYVVAEAVIFTPMYYIAMVYSGGASVLLSAAFITLGLFAGLTVAVFITKKDFSFLRTGLTAASFVAIGAIIGAALFGFSLGWFFLRVDDPAGRRLYPLHHLERDERVPHGPLRGRLVGALLRVGAHVLVRAALGDGLLRRLKRTLDSVPFI